MDESVKKLLRERYFLEEEDDWESLSERVSEIYPKSFELIKEMKFIPSTPTLMNGNTKGKRKGTLSSCFIMDIEDSISGIFDSLKEGALVTKSAGGVGYTFSDLRSSKEIVKAFNKNSSGPLPFMHIFNSMLSGVQQGAARRGAGMAQFDIFHPDILEVVRAKEKEEVLERFNISIRIPDEFYQKLKENPSQPHIIKYKDGTSKALEVDGKVISVGEIWKEIIENAWKKAEPGIFNNDIAFRQCTNTNISKKVASNP